MDEQTANDLVQRFARAALRIGKTHPTTSGMLVGLISAFPEVLDDDQFLQDLVPKIEREWPDTATEDEGV